MQHQFRFTAAVTHDFHLTPTYVTNAGAHRLAYRLFNGKTAGQTLWFTFTIPELLRREEASRKAVAVAPNATGNPVHFDQIYAHRQNHRPVSCAS